MNGRAECLLAVGENKKLFFWSDLLYHSKIQKLIIIILPVPRSIHPQVTLKPPPGSVQLKPKKSDLKARLHKSCRRQSLNENPCFKFRRGMRDVAKWHCIVNPWVTSVIPRRGGSRVCGEITIFTVSFHLHYNVIIRGCEANSG